MYGEHCKAKKIDQYKIAALYIRSFLKYKPFKLDVPKETKTYEICLYTKYPNEYFLIDLMEAILKAGNNDFNGKLLLGDFTYEFVKHLNYYKMNLSRLDPLSFANFIRLIEKKYFVRSKPL